MQMDPTTLQLIQVLEKTVSPGKNLPRLCVEITRCTMRKISHTSYPSSCPSVPTNPNPFLTQTCLPLSNLETLLFHGNDLSQLSLPAYNQRSHSMTRSWSLPIAASISHFFRLSLIVPRKPKFHESRVIFAHCKDSITNNSTVAKGFLTYRKTIDSPPFSTFNEHPRRHCDITACGFHI